MDEFKKFLKMEDNPKGDSSANNDKIRWGTIIPLIGGSAIGCQQATGNLPDFHLSYAPFAGNEKHIRNYWPSVPMHYLDKNSTNLPSFENVDFINSVCPCAGLSMLNTSSSAGKRRGADSAANQWMYESSVYVLSKVRPKVLWGENAPGLFTNLGEGVVEKLRKIGEHYGYSFSVMKTSTEFHGIPQRRVRTFYFFWRSPTVPMMTWYRRERKNFIDYLKEIPSNASMTDLYVSEGKASERSRFYQFVLEKEGLSHAEFVKKRGKGTVTTYLEENNLIDECIAWLNEKYPGESFWNKTGNNRTHVEYLEHVKKKREKGLGYWDDSPRFVGDTFAAVMKKTMMWAVHPEEDRFLNGREFAHLMGLPHDFEIDGERSLNHLAQNVPTCTARDMAEQVTRFIRGELAMTEFSFLKQDNTTQTVVASEVGSVPPVTEADLNNVERNQQLLLVLSQNNCTEDVKEEQKMKIKKSGVERKRKLKREISEEEKAMKELEREIKLEKIREKRREKEIKKENDRKLRMENRMKRGLRVGKENVQPRIKETPEPINEEEYQKELLKFMCYICKIFPREDSKNKSELYRHYSLVHFRDELREKYPLKVNEPCSLCPEDSKKIIKSGFGISHIGQTHLKVEDFLPVEYHIKESKRSRSSAFMSHIVAFPDETLEDKQETKDVQMVNEKKIKDLTKHQDEDEETCEIIEEFCESKITSSRVKIKPILRKKPDPIVIEDDSDDEEIIFQPRKRRFLGREATPDVKRTRYGRISKPRIVDVESIRRGRTMRI